MPLPLLHQFFPICFSSFGQNLMVSYIEATYLCILFTRNLDMMHQSNFYFSMHLPKDEQVPVLVDREKETTWIASNNFVNIMKCFKILSSFLTKEDIKELVPKFECFVCLMYDRRVNCLGVNSGRRQLFV